MVEGVGVKHGNLNRLVKGFHKWTLNTQHRPVR